MRIPDELLHSVGFLVRSSAPETYLGTGFMVNLPLPELPGKALPHLVTAKHVAIKLQADDAYFVITAPNGMREQFIVQAGGWVYHPTQADSVDVAVTIPGAMLVNSPKRGAIPEEMFATDERIRAFNIGLGHETITIGLFSGFYGKSRLTPLVRTGTIAMMPEDKIAQPNFGDIDAYLVEGFSMNHQSGSPVFVRSSLNQPVFTADGKRYHLEGGGPLHLLGLLQGHYESEGVSERQAKQNMGVTIVIPAKKILEALYNPDLVQLRTILSNPANWEPF